MSIGSESELHYKTVETKKQRRRKRGKTNSRSPRGRTKMNRMAFVDDSEMERRDSDMSISSESSDGIEQATERRRKTKSRRRPSTQGAHIRGPSTGGRSKCADQGSQIKDLEDQIKFLEDFRQRTARRRRLRSGCTITTRMSTSETEIKIPDEEEEDFFGINMDEIPEIPEIPKYLEPSKIQSCEFEVPAKHIRKSSLYENRIPRHERRSSRKSRRNRRRPQRREEGKVEEKVSNSNFVGDRKMTVKSFDCDSDLV
eukprot:UN30391